MQQHDTVTHEEAVIPSADLIQIDDADDAAAATNLGEQTAANVLHVVDTRRKNRADDRSDLIVTFNEWAYGDWSEYEVAEEPIGLVGRIEDYSEDAYFVKGAFWVDHDLIVGRPLEEVKGEYITDLVRQVDETDTDFAEYECEAYWPKSAVSSILTLGKS